MYVRKRKGEHKMDFVYLVFDEIHGLQCICGTRERADQELDYLAKQYEVQNEPLDYIGLSRKGWDGACWWDKVQVIN
jgi:hypothetical protein